jgi:3-isopropylmalate/(R)-2-methylmalate dehydratase large subunit
MMREQNLTILFPDRTVATVDHIIPTHTHVRPFTDEQAEGMMSAIERNCLEFGIRLFDRASGDQGIVHVIGPELGLTQPGMTIACGDSHTSTHGAFGAVAFGIGTSQVRDVLATQCLAIQKPKTRRIRVDGSLQAGVYAKDVTLHIIRTLGVNGGVGYAYEYAGEVLQRMSMEERMTVCNMSIEGGARCGYVNPDGTTIEYLRGRKFAPADGTFDDAARWWKRMASDADASYDDDVRIDGSAIGPVVTWGINPGQAIGVLDDRMTR